MTICPDDCPSTMGGSCACEPESKVFSCPECGTVPKHYPSCPLQEEGCPPLPNWYQCPVCTSDTNWCDCVYGLEGLALNAYYTSLKLQEKENN